MKLFTVIIATYNAEKTIERCLRSIVNQKKENVELVVIDGLSTDSTLKIIDKYKKDIDILVSEKDKGLYDAWNKGIMMSSGKWIMFIGADDYYVDGIFDFYEEFLRDKDTDKIDVISAVSVIVDKKGKMLRRYGEAYEWNKFRNYFKISHGSSLHNRNLFNEVGLFDIRYKISADYELLLRKKLNALFVDKELLVMQTGGASVTIKGLLQTYTVKQSHHTNYTIINIYYLIKGILGLIYRKLYWKYIKRNEL